MSKSIKKVNSVGIPTARDENSGLVGVVLSLDSNPKKYEDTQGLDTTPSFWP